MPSDEHEYSDEHARQQLLPRRERHRRLKVLIRRIRKLSPVPLLIRTQAIRCPDCGGLATYVIYVDHPAIEVVGGPRDGVVLRPGLHLPLIRLIDWLGNADPELEVNLCGSGPEELGMENTACVSIVGTWRELPVCVYCFSKPHPNEKPLLQTFESADGAACDPPTG